MGQVVIGMDPHKRSATIEVMAADETVAGRRPVRHRRGRVRRDAGRGAAVAGPDLGGRGLQGIGRHVAPGCWPTASRSSTCRRSCRPGTRVFATGQGRKTDATDAHSVALVGTRMAGLRPVVDDEQLAVLRVLADRRRSLGEDHTRMVSQLHQLLLELIPGGAKKDLSAAQAKALLAAGPAAGCRRQDPPPGRRRTHRRPGADLPAQEGRRQGTRGAGRGHRHQADGPARHRPVRRRPAAGRGRRHHPVPRPRPLRLLERHRARSTPPPATRSATGCPAPATGRSTGRCTSWPPSSSATPTGPRLLRPQSRRRQDPDGSHARPQTHGSPTSSTAR